MSKKKVKRVGSSSRQLLVRAAELEKLTHCAREHVRMAKLDLKQARQALKLAKKAAKRARKEAKAAGFTRKKLAKVQTARAEAKGIKNSVPDSLDLFQKRPSMA